MRVPWRPPCDSIKPGPHCRKALPERGSEPAPLPPRFTPQVFVDGISAEVLFAGAAPDFVGLNQINVRIPETLTPGPAVPLLVRSGKYTSNQVTLAVE